MGLYELLQFVNPFSNPAFLTKLIMGNCGLSPSFNTAPNIKLDAKSKNKVRNFFI
jgi:hypothetical protein